MAVLPSADNATEKPCRACPITLAPTSLVCWLHTPPLRVNTHAAPTSLLSPSPPTMAVLPSSDSATEEPWLTPVPTAPLPTSLFPCWLHVPPLRVNTHAAPPPALLLSKGPPTMAVWPLADSATEKPWSADPPAPVPTSSACCVMSCASAGSAGPTSATASKAGRKHRHPFLADKVMPSTVATSGGAAHAHGLSEWCDCAHVRATM